MGNKPKFMPIEDVAALLDVSIKILKRCTIASIVDFKRENGEIFLNMATIDNFLGIKSTAKILSVSPRTVRRYTKRESGMRLKSYRFNQKLCYQLCDIENFINKSSF